MRKSTFSIKLFVLGCLAIGYFDSSAQDKSVKTNGITIAYESFGKKNKETIILIQGTGAPMTDWPVELCQKLVHNGYRVIRFDNRDSGKSTHLDSLGQPDWAKIGPFVTTCNPAQLPYTIRDMCTDVIGLMDALKINKAHIAGVSMGGAIAQLIAVDYPKRVYTLTSIAATSGNPSLPWGNESTLKALGTPPPSNNNIDSITNYLVFINKSLGSTDNDQTLRKEALQHIHRSWYPEGTARQAAAILITDRCDRRAELAKIKLPVMVIHGDDDPLVPLIAGEDVAKSIANSELRIIKGMGHHISMKFIDELGDDIVENAKRVHQ
ncbi:alpha/beta hydrolase [Pedobacter yonginense]|uniref:Alpha/beta hydrolase n=1 Tax=Pedobacter yonginense TaxID=651869 RepID=A0A317EH12_9SPHI|nr:alpha/beta hydrolase [Pedobacter yonginense]PWS26111.1 alpha/beta hydrolase [Pedobacter yonginense]